MSEFDNLKNEAEQLAQQHPQQVKEGEDAVEKKFGMGQQGPVWPGWAAGPVRPGPAGPGQARTSTARASRTRATTARASKTRAARTSTARASRTRITTARASKTRAARTSTGQGQQDQGQQDQGRPAGPVRRRPAVGLLALSARREATAGAEADRGVVRHGCLVPVPCRLGPGRPSAAVTARADPARANIERR